MNGSSNTYSKMVVDAQRPCLFIRASRKTVVLKELGPRSRGLDSGEASYFVELNFLAAVYFCD